MAVSVVAGLASIGQAMLTAKTFAIGFALAFKAFAIGAGLSMVSRALMPKPDITTTLGGLEQTVREPALARQLIYGRAKVGGNIVFIETTDSPEVGENGFLKMIIALAGHEIDGFEGVYFDDELVWDGDIIAKYADDVDLAFYDGTQTEAHDFFSPSGWDDTCVLRDTAYIYVRLQYNDEVFQNGIPNVSVLLRGKKVLDPRTNTVAWSDNPALCINDYLTDEKYGLNADNVSTASVIASANDCDLLVDYDDDGTTEQHEKYRLNGVVSTDDKISTNIEMMLTSMAGRVVFTGGVFEVNSGVYVEPQMTIDESMIVGSIEFATKTSRRSTYNGVKGVFLSEESGYTLSDYPAQISSTYETEDGEPLYLDMTLPFTTNNVRAQRLAKLALLKSRQQRTLVVPVNLAGLKLKAGDTVNITNEKLGLLNAPYEVLDYQLSYSDNLVVNLSLIETASEYYDWNVSDQLDFSIANDVQLYNRVPIAPTGLTFNAGAEIKSDGSSQTYIDVSWTGSTDAFIDHYIVEYSNGSDKQSIRSNDTNHRITTFNDTGDYEVKVYSVNLIGSKSDAITGTVTSTIDTVAPDAPSNMVVTGGFNKIELSWVNPTDNDFDLIDVKVNTVNNESTATQLASLRASKFTHDVNESSATRYYWLRALDRTGNASDWVYAGSGTTQFLQVGDFDDGVISIDHIDQSFTNIIESKAPQSSLDEVVNDTQRIDNTLSTASEKLLQASLFAGEQAGIMRDAGVTVDPDNGSVTIQAVETLRSETDAQFTQVGIEVDAIEGQLGLYATRTFVEGEIAQAQLDPTEFQAFTDLQVRVNDVEIIADANEAELLLKASQVDFNSLEGRVETAESDIEINAGQIALKASQSSFDTLQSRVNTAEININAIDAPSITQTVKATRDIYNELDRNSVQTLKDVLDAYKTRKSIKRDVAFVQSEISANVLDTNEAVASARTELGARIDQNEASIISESNIRVSEDSALASRIDSLQVEVDDAEANILEINDVSATSDSAIARKVFEVDASVEDALGKITQLNTVDVTSTSALVQSYLGLSSTVGEHTSKISQNLSSIDGVKAQYSVTIDNNGHVSGFGLVSDIIDGNPTSSFTVNADSFAIGGTDVDDQYPFVVYTTDTNVVRDGETITIPAGTYIKDAFVSNLSANQIKTGELSATRISVDGITLERSGDNLVIKGGGVGTTQLADLAVTDGKIASISADKITAGTIDAEIISANSLAVTGDIPDVSGFITSVAWDDLTGNVPDDIATTDDIPDVSGFITEDDVPANPQWFSLTGRPNTNAPSDADFNTAFSRNPVTGDVLLVEDTSDPVLTKNYQYDGSAWNVITALIRGDMLVAGTLNANDIKTGTLEADRIKLNGNMLEANASGQLQILDEGVDTDQIADQAVTVPANNFTSGLTSFSNVSGETELQTVTVSGGSYPAEILASVRLVKIGGQIPANFIPVTIRIKRGSTVIRTFTDVRIPANNTVNNEYVVVAYDSSVPTGSQTYTVTAEVTSSYGNVRAYDRYIRFLGTKT